MWTHYGLGTLVASVAFTVLYYCSVMLCFGPVTSWCYLNYIYQPEEHFLSCKL